jgi:outer membrane receptor protein involved in Fe transport
MKFARFSYTRIMGFSFLLMALAVLTGIPAHAQESQAPRQLDRVEVLPPERRAAPAPARRSDRGTESDQASQSEAPSAQENQAPSPPSTTIGPATMSLVEGKSGVSMGAASLPAQVQTITPQDIQQLNVYGGYANLFSKVAGVKASNYGQGQMGTPITMRGFRSGIGSDIGIFVDGVPQNFPSCTSISGKSEISWVAPEVIERVEIIKGPFSALYGDFAMGGVVNIITKKVEPSSSVSSYGGSFGMYRAFGILSSEAAMPTPFLAHEYFTIDGYRDNAQLHQWSPFNKVSVPLWGGTLSLRYNYFQSDWGAPGYWPVDWVKSGLVNRKQAFNTTDGGRQKRYELVMTYAPACGERGLYTTLYVADYQSFRYASFLPFGSSQFARQDDRKYWGGRMYYNLVFGDIGSLIVGGETRQDSGEAQQYNTYRTRRTTNTYDYDLRLSNWAVFLQGQIKPSELVKIVGGVRWDYFWLDIDNITRPQNSGKGYPLIRSPKIGFVMTPTENFNIFGNIGCGFRSPSNLEMSPYKAGTRTDFGLDPALVQTYDIGCNASVFGNLYVAADYYQTNMQREIRMVNNNPVVIGDTVRKGYELEAKYYPSDAINFFASYAWVETKVIDPSTPGRILVPEISEHSIKAGVSMQRDFGPYGKVMADLYYEYYSGAPYYRSSGTAAQLATPIFGPDFDLYNMKLSYSGRGWSSFVSARCKPREYASDYTWVSENLLVFDPQPPWDFAAGLSYTFW